VASHTNILIDPYHEALMTEEIIERFSRIAWMNMALISLKTDRKDEVDDFLIEVIDQCSEIEKRFELRFADTTYVRMSVDFASKRANSDSIASAGCRSDSSWKTSLIKANPYDNFDSYLDFEIGLVPKGGLINLLARDFTLRRL
jgi:hypothetical protein